MTQNQSIAVKTTIDLVRSYTSKGAYSPGLTFGIAWQNWGRTAGSAKCGLLGLITGIIRLFGPKTQGCS